MANVSLSCNLCDIDDPALVYPAGVAQRNQIVRCNRCGLTYANPREDADCVVIDTWEDNPDWDLAKDPSQRYEKERLQVSDYKTTRALLGRLHPERGKLVEVGSGLGFQLEAFRRDGWDVLGIDPDRNGCRHATQELKIPTYASTLEATNLQNASADVVVMLHVIEHLPDPLSTLREVYRILKPGGHLVIETPRYDTLMYKLLGSRERSLRCDGHIYFYTTASLRRTYQAAGFKLVRLDYVGRSLTLDRLAYNLGVILRSKSAEATIDALLRRVGLRDRVIHLNLRDMQRVCVQRD